MSCLVLWLRVPFKSETLKNGAQIFFHWSAAGPRNQLIRLCANELSRNSNAQSMAKTQDTMNVSKTESKKILESDSFSVAMDLATSSSDSRKRELSSSSARQAGRSSLKVQKKHECETNKPKSEGEKENVTTTSEGECGIEFVKV